MNTSARAYAVAAHGDQKYGDKPYSMHLDDVVYVLVEFGFTDPVMQASAYLHDVVEDTKVTLEQLQEDGFTDDVIYIVDGVTSVPGPNRKTRNTATYPRIAESVQRIIVKLADRIANTRRSLAYSPGLYQMYSKEYPAFRAALCTDNAMVAGMWAELDKLMNRSSQ